MTRRALLLPVAFAMLITIAPGSARAVDDPRFALKFVEELRDRGLYDLALDYLAELRQSPDTPTDIKARLDFEEGRALIDAATHGSDPDRAKEQLDRARTHLDTFIKANAASPLVVEALVELAHLLYERGRTAAVSADDAKTPAEKETRLIEARGFYGNAREAYNQVYTRLETRFKTFPNFLEDNDPLKAEKDRVHGALMNAELQRAVVDYEEAQSFALGTPQRKEILDRAGKAFESVYKRYRTQLAGITAQMWMGKCFEESGDFGAAKGIYDQLLEHADPRLRPLQKKVDYFRILLMGKRKDFALAADEAVNWLKAFPNDRRSYEALGVQLELAKSILAQVPDAAPDEKAKGIARATSVLVEVVKVYSPFKAEALALLKQYAPKTAVNADAITKLNFDDAVAQADGSISTGEYDKAIVILRYALKKGVGTQPIDKINKARYTLAYSLYMTKHYYDAAVLTEHIARRYPNAEWAAKATEIAMASFLDAYNDTSSSNRIGDLIRLDNLARYTAETWPDTEQGDTGRMTAGQIALGSGKYAEAIKFFESVRSQSSKSVDAQGFSADAHWKNAQSLREKDPASKPADAEVQRSIALYQGALKARKDAGAGNADLGVIANAGDLATIDLEIGKPDETLKLLDPIAKTLASTARSPSLNVAYARVMAIRLRAHVAVGQVDLALADMNALEASKAGGDRAQLYYELGKLLEKEMDNLRKKNDSAGLDRTQQAYKRFLGALVASKSGQTYDSLMWAGTNLLKLGAYAESGPVFEQILKIFGEDPTFLAQPGNLDRILMVRLKQVSSLRGSKQFDEADAKFREIAEKSGGFLEVQMERGYILSDKAAARKISWAQAYDYWQKLASKLRNASPKPVQYYEAWYQAAKALQSDGKSTLAKQTLAGVMRLSPKVGNPEMKAKYDELIAKLK
jgi:hypothetical protein